MSSHTSQTTAPKPGAQLEAFGIGKHFGAFRALHDVTLEIGAGEVRGLVGENGAGKSTLGKIIAGVVQPDTGELRLGGRPVRHRSAADALDAGVALIAQELAGVPQRTVAENVLLGSEPRRGIFVDTRRLEQRYSEVSEEAGFGLPGDALLGSLRKSDQQKVEIMRAVARGARLIVMDEPTAALSSDEAKQLVAITRRLAGEGRTIVFVSHHLNEVLAVCDQVSVLRDGQLVRTGPAEAETPDSLVTAMIGRSVTSEFPPKTTPPRTGVPALRVSGLSSSSGLRDIDLQIWPGEILGVAGLVGSGRSELIRAIFGVDDHDGQLEMDGAPVTLGSTRAAIDAGVAMLPESRKELGLVLGRSVLENVTLPHLHRMGRWTVGRRQERTAVQSMMTKVGVRTSATTLPVGALSGGNQQKVMFAKWLLTSPRILLADEPTQGVDVGARETIYALIAQLAEQGLAVLLVSSELEEVIGLSHRVMVMRNGGVVDEFTDVTATAESILASAFGTDGVAK